MAVFFAYCRIMATDIHFIACMRYRRGRPAKPFWPVRCRPAGGAGRLPKRTAVARRPAVNPVNAGEVARRAGEVAVLSSSPLRKMPIKWKNPLYRIAALWYNFLINLGSPLLDNTIVVKGGGNGGTNVL